MYICYKYLCMNMLSIGEPKVLVVLVLGPLGWVLQNQESEPTDQLLRLANVLLACAQLHTQALQDALPEGLKN